jgi:transposase
LDVHAWSVTGHALDGVTGEVWQRKLTPDPADVLGWLQRLPQPVTAAYEAGPTGFGLARLLRSRGMVCLVAAPSKLQRPWGDRVKTDSRDAELLARLLKLGEIVEVVVPAVEQEAARDLVRAREDVRGDLMRARHRLSKLLLRQGIVYTGGLLSPGPGDACPLGAGTRCGAGPRPPGEPAAAPAVAKFHRPPEAASDRQRRRRP